MSSFLFSAKDLQQKDETPEIEKIFSLYKLYIYRFNWQKYIYIFFIPGGTQKVAKVKLLQILGRFPCTCTYKNIYLIFC